MELYISKTVNNKVAGEHFPATSIADLSSVSDIREYTPSSSDIGSSRPKRLNIRRDETFSCRTVKVPMWRIEMKAGNMFSLLLLELALWVRMRQTEPISVRVWVGSGPQIVPRRSIRGEWRLRTGGMINEVHCSEIVHTNYGWWNTTFLVSEGIFLLTGVLYLCVFCMRWAMEQ